MFKTLGCLIGSMLVGAALLSFTEPRLDLPEPSQPIDEESVEAIATNADVRRLGVVAGSGFVEVGDVPDRTHPTAEHSPTRFHYAIHRDGSVSASPPWAPATYVGTDPYALQIVLPGGTFRSEQITYDQWRVLRALLGRPLGRAALEVEPTEALRLIPRNRLAMLVDSGRGKL